MCFGTAVEDKLDAGKLPEVQEATDTQGAVPTPTPEETIEFLLLEVINQNVDAAAVIGKEGVHSVARALLMLPTEGPTTPEGREAFKQFVHNEAKRLVAGAIAEAEEQGDFSGR